MKQESAEPLGRPRILLVGDAAARPLGLERALTRAGFQLVERQDTSVDPQVDAVLITLNDIKEGVPEHLLRASGGSGEPPRILITAATDRDAPGAALCCGASDALSGPVHLPELCARLHARIKESHRRLTSLQPGAGAAHSAATSLEENYPVVRNGRSPASRQLNLLEADTTFQALDRRVREEFERARRYSLSFSLILLGVDEFAAVRERQGPEAADRLKGEVASVLRRELRLPDFVIGYGASDFAVILPETGPTGARQSVLRVRERLARVPSDGDPRVKHPRFSAGIVSYPHPAVAQSDELYAIVEAALMRGKAQSGERIGVAV